MYCKEFLEMRPEFYNSWWSRMLLPYIEFSDITYVQIESRDEVVVIYLIFSS